MHRRTTLVAVALASVVGLLAGCGAAAETVSTNDSSAAPKTELTAAVKALYSGSALTTTLSVPATAASIHRLVTAGGATASALTTSQAQALVGSHVVVEALAPNGKTLQDTKGGLDGGAFAITAGTGSSTYLSVREVHQVVYAQVDVKRLLALLGQTSRLSTLVARVRSLPGFVQALVAGRWVSLPVATLSMAQSFLGGMAGGTIPSSSTLEGLIGSLATTIDRDLTVTRTSTGTTDQLVATGNIRSLDRDLLATIGAAVPAVKQLLEPRSPGGVPNRNVSIDAAVTGGTLSRLSVDLGQLSLGPPGQAALPFVATFARSGAPITAPAGAQPLELGQLGSLFGAAGGST